MKNPAGDIMEVLPADIVGVIVSYLDADTAADMRAINITFRQCVDRALYDFVEAAPVTHRIGMMFTRWRGCRIAALAGDDAPVIVFSCDHGGAVLLSSDGVRFRLWAHPPRMSRVIALIFATRILRLLGASRTTEQKN